MPPRSLIAGFLGRFVLVYGLLIAPWPGFNRAYGAWFRALGQLTFAREGARRIVEFEPVPAELHHRLDTRVALANRDQVDRNGNVPVMFLEMDARGLGWVPTALLLALVAATPVSWRRRGLATVTGLFAVHGYILFAVGSYIWNRSTELELLALSPFWKQIVGGLEETLVTQLGASFVIPVIIWIFVTLRRQDLVQWRESAGRLAA